MILGGPSSISRNDCRLMRAAGGRFAVLPLAAVLPMVAVPLAGAAAAAESVAEGAGAAAAAWTAGCSGTGTAAATGVLASALGIASGLSVVASCSLRAAAARAWRRAGRAAAAACRWPPGRASCPARPVRAEAHSILIAWCTRGAGREAQGEWGQQALAPGRRLLQSTLEDGRAVACARSSMHWACPMALAGFVTRAAAAATLAARHQRRLLCCAPRRELACL